MIVINTIEELTQKLSETTQEIGFVPTMGALHDGHISLIKQSKLDNPITVVSIFVNPTQFLAGEDLEKYPRKDDSDKKICELCNVDYLFMPNINTMYTDDEVLLKAPKIKGFILEGYKRPGHFDGMLQIVLKLLNIVNPANAYFGKKDAQQLSLIIQMVKNLYIKTNIIACDIVREKDGLAMSSRNIYLTTSERKIALNISKSLELSAKLIGSGETSVCEVVDMISNHLNKFKIIEIEYIEIVNVNFEQIDTVEINNTIILIAVKISNTRLIDNIWI